MIPEGRSIFPNLTVSENLLMYTFRRRGLNRADVEEQAIARFPALGTRRRQLAGTLSGGEQRMLSMARALTTEPEILLLDELSMGLAPLIVEELYDVVGQLVSSEQLTIVMVEQFVQTALTIADRAVVMVNGELVPKRSGPTSWVPTSAPRHLRMPKGEVRPQASGGNSTVTLKASASAVRSSSTPPASTRSLRAASTDANVCAGPETTNRLTLARMERFSVVLARRTAPRTSAATVRTEASPSTPKSTCSPSSPTLGHGARCTDPGCHHRHTSSVTKGRNGAKSRSCAERARASVARAESVAGDGPSSP